MTKLVHRSVILAKTETTYGTDAIPTAASNAIMVQTLAYKPAGLRIAARPSIKMTIGQLQSLYVGSLLEVTCDVELKGSGTAGGKPEMDPLLLCCSMASSLVGTVLSYNPASTAQPSATLYIYEDGSLYKLTGCRGTLKLNLKTGDIPTAAFTITGHYSVPTDVALPAPTYQSSIPASIVDTPITIGSFGPIIESLTLDLGNTVQMPPDMAAADGYGEIIISARNVTGTLDPEATLVAAADLWSEFMSNIFNAELTTGIFGSVQVPGFRVSLTCPKIYYQNLEPANRNDIVTYGLTFGAAETDGDDEFTLSFS